MEKLTDIGRIGIVKRSGSEWSFYTKKFFLDKKPDFAVIRADSYGVCGIFINGEFVESSMGRFMNRIMCVECTSKLRAGENEIMLKLGNHYYQGSGLEIYKRRGAWFSAAAVELELSSENGSERLTTDESWECQSDDGQTRPQCFSEVTWAEYDRFWRRAALWKEADRKLKVPEEVVRTVGEAYRTYAEASLPEYAEPLKIIGTNMSRKEDGSLTSRISDLGALYIYDESELPYVSYDFGRLYVGYAELFYEADRDGSLTLYFDYSESADDLKENSRYWPLVKQLSLHVPIKKGKNRLFLVHRRACRYMRLQFQDKYCTVQVKQVRIRLSMKPSEATGWFHCSDQELNRIWEVGKYTLFVNKHQEYESCPRNEMKYFSGDGIIDALVDYYAFGDSALVDASLSLTEIEGCGGMRHDIYGRNESLWDYPAWRIITVYNQYRYWNDPGFVKKYYDDAVMCLLWMLEKVNGKGLIYQYPLLAGAFYNVSGSVEYNCSFDRLGEKPYLNALLYKSLLCMRELGEVMKDERAAEWGDMALRVRAAVNEYLWDEKAGAYVDTYDPSYIPQDGNAVAVLYGAADEDRARRILQTLRRENWSSYGSAILSRELDHTRGGLRTISPAMCMYEAEGRFLHGDGSGALELISRCWGTMLRKGAGTFWEFAPNNGTERWPIPAHAWSAGCTYLLSAYVLGIRPETPGFESLHFEPYGGMEEFEGVVPTNKGFVGVCCKVISGRKTYRLAVPKGMEINAVLPSDAVLHVTEYECNSSAITETTCESCLHE